MTLLLAAVGATVTALLELSVGPYLRVETSQPHLVLVLGVIVTIAIGLEAGLTWGFIGGLVLDVLAQRPLGSTALRFAQRSSACLLARLVARLRTSPSAVSAGLLLDDLFVAFNALRATIGHRSGSDPAGRYTTPSGGAHRALAVTIRRRADVERVGLTTSRRRPCQPSRFIAFAWSLLAVRLTAPLLPADR
jgi:rod shape-determining protein MreD